MGGIKANRKQRAKEGNDLQQRSLTRIEPGMLPLCSICLNRSGYYYFYKLWQQIWSSKESLLYVFKEHVRTFICNGHRSCRNQWKESLCRMPVFELDRVMTGRRKGSWGCDFWLAQRVKKPHHIHLTLIHTCTCRHTFRVAGHSDQVQHCRANTDWPVHWPSHTNVCTGGLNMT